MACGNPGAVRAIGPFAEDTFLEQWVTHHARVGGPSSHVFVDKVFHNYLAELFAYVGNVVFNSQSGSKSLCFEHFVRLFLTGVLKWDARPRCAW